MSASARGAPNRVPLAQAHARAALRWTLAFVVAAAVVAALGERWLALHLFGAGALVSAIGGVAVMLAVTWSAAPAPPTRVATAQRWALALGAVGIAVGRRAGLDAWFIGVAGAVYLGGLLAVAGMLVATAVRAPERRFVPAVAAYLVAIAAGLAGSAVGIGVATSRADPLRWRDAHAVLNLLGLVGITIAGTLPFFAATVGRSRMNPAATSRRLLGGAAAHGAALTVAVVGLVIGSHGVASIGLVGDAGAVAAAASTMPRPNRRQWRWAGPRLVGVWVGAGWWPVAVLGTAADAAEGRLLLHGRWLGVLVVGGYAQILWGSLAYLLPMLRGGGHEHLARGFARTRSWLGLVAANVAAVALAADVTLLALFAVGVWLVDAAWRAAALALERRNVSPDAPPPAPAA